MHRLLTILALLLASLTMQAQTDMQLLQRWLNGVSKYDNEYPREKVYLHTDQDSYVQGETMWIKAMVVRASSLMPRPVSRVLYVELLNTDGQIVDRQLLQIDANGQAEGHIELCDPIHDGFYELRAYTREMVNWHEEAIYSKIIPVFDERLDISVPDLKSTPTPPADATGALTSEESSEGYILTAGEGVDSMQLCALLVTCRERPCYVDTLTVGGAAGLVQLELERSVLHDGWNQCYLMTTRGTSLGQCKIWKDPTIGRELRVSIQQNKGSYAPFAPVAVEVQVSDAQGRPVRNAEFSLAVRDRDGFITQPVGADMTQHLLDDQGGERMPLEVMTGATPFALKQPIEDKLLLQGQLFRDNDKRRPMPNFNLFVNMYSPEGGALSGDARTDEEGRFAFTSNEDYMGDWIAQFSVRNDEGKRKWSRVALNRWFALQPHRWTTEDFELERITALSPAEEPVAPRLFEWEDTIPRINKAIALAEAKVMGKGKYSGLKGDRFSHRGGEKRGMHFADKYINIPMALEQWKDQGGGGEFLQDFLPLYDKDFEYYNINYHTPFDKIPNEDQVEGLNFHYKGKKAVVFIDNQLCTVDHDLYRLTKLEEAEDMRSNIGRSRLDLQTSYWASEIKSVLVMERRDNWWRFTDYKEQVWLEKAPEIETAIFVYTRPKSYLYKGKKGVDMRIIQGFQKPVPYPAPQYNGLEPEDKEDYRRTLYWAPRLTTNDEGKASVVFFNGARPDTELSFSLRGITPDGHIINVEQ
ncbi:MAG: hypothetical protein MJZ40_02470 [Bacteroidaceae bacterium]|nr:hypothetical protein [Bacteroidaceae bacterium]